MRTVSGDLSCLLTFVWLCLCASVVEEGVAFEHAVVELAFLLRAAAEGALKRHFLDMGITKGVVVTMERVAPFGDPVAVRLRGYSLSLRRAEAKKIVLEAGA